MDYLIVVELFIGVSFAFIAFYFFSRAHGDHRTYDRRGDDSYDEREATATKATKTKARNTKTKKATKATKTKAQTAIIVGSALLLLS